jgi:hypothetical protein
MPPPRCQRRKAHFSFLGRIAVSGTSPEPETPPLPADPHALAAANPRPSRHPPGHRICQGHIPSNTARDRPSASLDANPRHLDRPKPCLSHLNAVYTGCTRDAPEMHTRFFGVHPVCISGASLVHGARVAGARCGGGGRPRLGPVRVFWPVLVANQRCWRSSRTNVRRRGEPVFPCAQDSPY